MSDEFDELKRRLVVGHKRDGRSVYDETAKAELVALCMQPGASVSRIARECGVNANQVGRWLRESGQGRRRRVDAVAARAVEAFVAVPIVSGSARSAGEDDMSARTMILQARLPNGVTVDLREMDPPRVGEIIEALGRLRCSASTKA